MMTRVFHSVGQGGFYTEEFGCESFNIVYDCGGKGKIINKEIKGTFNENQKIDLVFISHLHDDHINGLEFLLKRCDVKKIVLPQIHDDQKIQLLIENVVYGQNDQYVASVIANPKEVLGERVVFVKQYNPDNPDNPEQSGDAINAETLSGEILSGKKITGGANTTKHCEWVFVPFNFGYNSNTTKELVDDLKAKGIELDNLIEKLKEEKTRNEIIGIYKGIFKKANFNKNSLVLYSGPSKEHHHCDIESYGNCYYYKWMRDKAGCLYTGDYTAKPDDMYQQLEKAFKDYDDYIGTLQVPHHGSCGDYFNDKLVNHERLCIISAGKSNKYRHPCARTIKEIVCAGGMPCVATEKPCTRIVQRCHC